MIPDAEKLIPTTVDPILDKAPVRGRKTASREYTPSSQIQDIRHGYLFAEHQGSRLNTMLTINYVAWKGNGWIPAATTQEHAASLRERMRKMLSDFCRRNGIQPIWVYAHENDADGGVGPHAHFIMHIPESQHSIVCDKLEVCLRKKMKWSASNIRDLKARKHLDKSVRLPFWFSIHNGSRFLSKESSETKLAYLAKPLPPTVTITYRGKDEPLFDHSPVNDDGKSMRDAPVTLQRQSANRPSLCAACSKSINAKARSDAGWKTAEKGFEWISRAVARDQLRAKAVRTISAIHILTNSLDND